MAVEWVLQGSLQHNAMLLKARQQRDSETSSSSTSSQQQQQQISCHWGGHVSPSI
jgi:hypothetical protein